MKTKLQWTRNNGDAAWIAKAAENVSLYVTPERTRGFMGDPARGTVWRFGATHWCERTKTASIFGRDCYRERAANRAEAMKMAEALYAEATCASPS